jgi:hypothetical protein
MSNRSPAGGDVGRRGLAADLGPVVARYWGALRRILAGGLAGSTAGRDRDRDPDPDVVALLSAPFSGVDDVYDRLSAVETHLRNDGDGRAVFLTVYVAMTARVRAGIADGRFEDPDWVRQYLVAFAEEYRRTVVDFERGRRVPPAWRVAFEASLQGETIVLQDALLGINAHIVNDLAFALADVGIGAGEERARRYADHLAINEVLAGLADVVQTTLASVYEASGLADVDDLLGRFDEAATLTSLRAAREFAWENATLLVDWPRLAPLIRWRVRTVATGTAYAILSPTLDPGLRDRLREIENGEPILAAVSGAVHGHDPDTSRGRGRSRRRDGRRDREPHV